jgi:hypothetical protein
VRIEPGDCRKCPKIFTPKQEKEKTNKVDQYIQRI